MGFVAVQSMHFLQFQHLSIYAHLSIATPSQLVEKLAVMALSAPYQRSQQVAFAAGIAAHHQVYNLFIRVAYHLLAAFGREGAGALGIQQTQEVVDFRDGAHRTAGVVAGGFLLYGNDGAKAGDFFYFGLLQYAHEVLGVGGKGIHVTPLTLCIQGVKSQGALAAATEARDHYKFPAGNGHVNVLQVVGPRSVNLDILLFRHRLQRYEEIPYNRRAWAYKKDPASVTGSFLKEVL